LFHSFSFVELAGDLLIRDIAEVVMQRILENFDKKLPVPEIYAHLFFKIQFLKDLGSMDPVEDPVHFLQNCCCACYCQISASAAISLINMFVSEGVPSSSIYTRVMGCQSVASEHRII
jgi:hypothetical protein